MDDDEINQLGFKLARYIVGLMGPGRPDPKDLMPVMEKTVGATLRISYPTLEEQKKAADKFHRNLISGLEFLDTQDRGRPN